MELRRTRWMLSAPLPSSGVSARKQTILGKARACRCRSQSSGMKTSRTRESPSPGPAFACRLLASIVVRVQLRALVLQEEGGVLGGGDGEEGAGRRSEVEECGEIAVGPGVR